MKVPGSGKLGSGRGRVEVGQVTINIVDAGHAKKAGRLLRGSEVDQVAPQQDNHQVLSVEALQDVGAHQQATTS